MSKPDLILAFNVAMAQPGATLRQVMAELRDARAFFDKLDVPPKPEQPQLQLAPPDPPAVIPEPPTDPVPAPNALVPDRNGRHWTAAERARAEALLDWGTSVPRVADMMGRTVKGVQAALSVGTLKPKNWKPDPQSQASGRRSALSRGFVLRNGLDSPPS